MILHTKLHTVQKFELFFEIWETDIFENMMEISIKHYFIPKKNFIEYFIELDILLC